MGYLVEFDCLIVCVFVRSQIHYITLQLFAISIARNNDVHAVVDNRTHLTIYLGNILTLRFAKQRVVRVVDIIVLVTYTIL